MWISKNVKYKENDDLTDLFMIEEKVDWTLMFNRLKRHQEETGSIHHTSGELAIWCENQRKNKRLSKAKRKRLEELGFFEEEIQSIIEPPSVRKQKKIVYPKILRKISIR